jgi:hypothetical protein
MTNAQNIIDRAAKLGISANIWEKTDKLRIYAQTGRRDISVYLEVDGTRDEIYGAALKVFCNTPQHPNWVKSQIAKYRQNYVGLFHAYVFEQYKDKDTGRRPNGYGVDINEMIDEARAFVAAREADQADDDAE